VPPGFGLLRNLFRIPCPCRPASGCCATYSASLARAARLRVAAQLIPHPLPVPPGFGLLRNLFRIPCPCRPASGCCATYSAFLARAARFRVAAQLIPHSLPVPPGFGLLRNSTPWQASLWLSPISAPVFADGLPGRKKGNQISLVAFVKPGGA